MESETIADLSLARSCDIHLRIISQQINQPSISKFSFEIGLSNNLLKSLGSQWTKPAYMCQNWFNIGRHLQHWSDSNISTRSESTHRHVIKRGSLWITSKYYFARSLTCIDGVTVALGNMCRYLPTVLRHHEIYAAPSATNHLANPNVIIWCRKLGQLFIKHKALQAWQYKQVL